MISPKNVFNEIIKYTTLKKFSEQQEIHFCKIYITHILFKLGMVKKCTLLILFKMQGYQ